MGARAAKAVDWASRASRIALAASLAVVAVGAASDFGFTVPLEVAIQRGLGEVATPEALDGKARAALDADDIPLARGLADLGAELGRPLPAETLARLAAAEAPGATAWRNARGFAHGFATGDATGSAALAGALASDLTVVGDVRDLAREGGRLARGEEHSDLILGLAAAGVAVTAASYATLGAAAPARFGVSVLKAARRAGTMTAEFAADLGRRLAKAGEASADAAARRTGAIEARAGAAATEAGGAAALRTLSGAASELKAVGGAVGAGETVRLMKYVRNVDELPELRRFTTRFGARSRAVAELTGKASLRVFRTSIRVGEMLLRHLWAVLMWFGGLVLGSLSRLVWRGVRFAALRI
ncbi:hypothetical protein [Hansschlegelia beijingensis]|uniref:Uncharacterized protein n=1 Tax=Hansschlegelia beijingensis TaxID=1133344 RepID=A0A7W6D000_9HYPH|nr:hypothetical protein [Hansschlegelia beijingensis]MBB3973477.1 hypothetical protein [Hansschlegelia beijingensis]